MKFRIRPASAIDAPALMHIEQACRSAAWFLPAAHRDPGLVRARNWGAWLNCSPPHDRHPTPRAAFLAYQYSDLLGFVAVMHDSLFAGYGADVAGLHVLPEHRRMGIGTRLMATAAAWLRKDGVQRMTADCFAHDPCRGFFDRRGGFVIASVSDETDMTARVTYGFANLRELAATDE